MKKLLVLVPMVFLFGCSGSPSKSDIQASLMTELQKGCQFVQVSDVKLLNSTPHPSDNNYKKVKFSANVGVKIEGELLERQNKYIKALSVYEKYIGEYSEFKEAHDKRISEINKELGLNDHNRKMALDEYGQPTAKSNKIFDDGSNLLKAKVEASNLLENQANELFDKYAEEANGLLTPLKSGALRYFSEVSPPEVPFGCLGYRDPQTPLGILYQSVANRDGKKAEYFNGVSVEIEAERTMQRTDKGWMFAGQL